MANDRVTRISLGVAGTTTLDVIGGAIANQKRLVSVAPYTIGGHPDVTYRDAVVGFSVLANSGTWGIRFLYYNPAAPGSALNAKVLNAGTVGLTGVGLSSGFFDFKRFGIELTADSVALGSSSVTFHDVGVYFPTHIEFHNAAGSSNALTIKIDGAFQKW